MRTYSLAFIAFALAGCAGPAEQGGRLRASPAEAEQIGAGANLAAALCAQCHAVDGAGPSPMEGAPAFQDIAARYDFEVLRDELIAGVHVGPGEMPTFQLTLAEVDALIAYLRAASAPRGDAGQ